MGLYFGYRGKDNIDFLFSEDKEFVQESFPKFQKEEFEEGNLNGYNLTEENKLPELQINKVSTKTNALPDFNSIIKTQAAKTGIDENLLKDAYEVPNFTYMIQYKDSEEVKINSQDFVTYNYLVYGGANVIQYYIKLSEEDLPKGLEIMEGEYSSISNISRFSDNFAFLLSNKLNIKDKNIGIYGLDNFTSNYRLLVQINKNVINEVEIQNITLYCNSYSIKA